ncbi:MAG: RagB/SusD family nutrient uptake outer membrane protein [Chitinophagaceae bacterium]|nr:RagB/SusD family nutrient uptake outer membrane protein [Chitinophagaceae bacterium]MCW5927681.1 RagB/SusD family nutrient uptake outer membrane protein [Chitinophagaceae bacterium]
MKSIIQIIIMLVLISACNKSKLDLLPHGPTELSYFREEADFTKAIIGVYAKINDVYWFRASGWNSTVPILILMGDDVTTNEDEDFETFGRLQPSNGRLTEFYRVWYQLVSRANVVLEKVEQEDGIYKTPDLKEHHKGEALFLRGYAFYMLWNYYGTAPLSIVRITSSDQFTPSGTTGTQLLDQAILDFEQASGLLPDSWNEANRGRVTKNSARGMLGKSLVFRASVTQAAEDYSKAITAFNAITGVSLVPDFGDNFAFDTENNAESLFEYQSTQAFAFNNVWLPNDFDNAIGNLSVFWGYYDNNNGLYGKPPFAATNKLVNAFDADDPRREETLNPADHMVRKYVSRNRLDQAGVGSINNPRILRYADVLLLKAEAILQSGGSTSAAIDLINEVRTRARNMVNGGSAPANYSNAETNKSIIMDWIMKERFLELSCEGQRWLDLRRWHMQGVISLDNAFFNSNSTAMAFQAPKHLVLPIPNIERDVNPNVEQNTGY